MRATVEDIREGQKVFIPERGYEGRVAAVTAEREGFTIHFEGGHRCAVLELDAEVIVHA